MPKKKRILIAIGIVLAMVFATGFIVIPKVYNRSMHRSNCSLDIDLENRTLDFEDVSGDGVHFYWVHPSESTSVTAVGKSRLVLNGTELPRGGYHFYVSDGGWDLDIKYFDIEDGTLQEIADQVEARVRLVLEALEFPTDQFTYDLSAMNGNFMEVSELVRHPDEPNLGVRYFSKYLVRGEPELTIRLFYHPAEEPAVPWTSDFNMAQDPEYH